MKKAVWEQLGNNVLGDNVSKFRKMNRYTQEQLAEKVNVDVKTISRLENGGNTDILTLLRITKALGMDSVDMLIK